MPDDFTRRVADGRQCPGCKLCCCAEQRRTQCPLVTQFGLP
jgi:hypothetical protein